MKIVRRYPSSRAQLGLWLLRELDPTCAAYNAMSTWRIRSRVDRTALEAAWAGVTERNESLRTTYRMAGGHLIAEVRDRADSLVSVDAAGWTRPDLMSRVSDEAHRPFDLERESASRAVLFSASPEEHVLLLSAHHIAADGWSNRIIMKELGALYDAHATASTPSLPHPASSCENFAQWQSEMLAGPAGERLWSYWQSQLDGDLTGVQLPTDRPRSTIRRHRGASETVRVDGDLALSLGQLARSLHTTRFVVLLAAFQALIARSTGQAEFVLGSVAHGRTVPRFRRTVGNLMNQILLRADLSGDPSFTDVARSAREAVRGALAHQAYPFSLLVERLKPRRDRGHSALCDVTFGLSYMIGESGSALDWKQLSLTALPVERRTSQGDLDVQLVESADGMVAVFQYDTDLFDGDAIRRMGQHYVRSLREYVECPARRISEVRLLDDAERGQLIRSWAHAPAEWAEPERIERLVEAQVERTPDAIAVSAAGRCLTYRALDERANQLAHRLQELGIGPDVPVAICMDRSPDLIVGLLAILKAGGAYVPLDPSLPVRRLTFLVEDAGCRVLVTEHRFLSLFAASPVPLVTLDGPEASGGREHVGKLTVARGKSSRDRAYILYTSGSTGTPKGVEIEQRGAANAVRDVIDRLRLGPADVWTAITTIAFDVASLEIWAALAAGARLEVVPSTVVADGERLAAAVQDAGTTVLLGTPTLWRMLLDSGWSGQSGLKMICGGEPLTRSLADALLARGAELWNQYGPTETTMYVTTEQVMRGEEGTPTLGRPIANARAYVLDAQGEPTPIGMPGELWIAGIQVARGYLNRPDETARSFHNDPWSPGDRRYRTGDLARYREDGKLEYLGRLDAQVKIRGHRVELGEIEAVIASHPAVRSAVVTAPASGDGGGLVAYCVLRQNRVRPTWAELQSFLRTTLPSHMIPTDFALLDRLPVTPSGKVDRRAVARAALHWIERSVPEAEPTTGVEQTVAGIWAHVLKLEQVKIHENFFELGGHSLLATQVVSRIREALHVELPLRDLFEAPTVADLSRRIADRLLTGNAALHPAIQPRVDIGPAPLSFSQERMWFLHQLAPGSAAYNVPMAIRVRGPIDIDALTMSLRDIARRHAILRTVFPVIDGAPVQIVTDIAPEITVEDLEAMSAHTRETRARALCRVEARRPFDLARGPLVRVLVLCLSAHDHIALLNMHHIVCDQWSFGVLGRELIALYDAHCAGRPSPLEPLDLQFGDFATWQREWLSDSVLQAQLAFWRRHLGGSLPVLDLPADRTRPVIPSYEGGCEARRLALDLRSSVEAFSRRERASVFMTLMAAFTALLARYSGGDDILVGVPIANRNYLASEHLIGDFVNTLPIRTKLPGDPTFHELLRQVRSTLLDAYAHQDAPFDKLVQELQPERYASHTPMVQVLMNLVNAPMPPERWADLTWQPFLFDRGTAQFDLTLTIEWEREGWVILEYSSDLFDHETAARIVDHFEMVLRAAVANPDGRLSQLPLLAPRDAKKLLEAWNQTAVDGGSDDSIHALFEMQADRTPDAVAVVDREGSLTYRELDSRANQVAWYLRTLGVGPETTVGVCLDRSRTAFAALLGVLKAGGAFVPLDPSYPSERLGFMMADSGAPVLITEQRQPREWLPEGVQVVLLDRDRAVIAHQSTERLGLSADGDGLAYVIYTSGSTGIPKGVLGLHRGAINRFRWMWRTYPFRRGEMCCQKTSTSFVDSIWELFGPLLRGVPIAVIPDDIVRDPRELIRMLAERRVTRLVLVPSLLRAMLDAEPHLGARLPDLHLWVSSGETLCGDLARRFRTAVPRALLLNLYGSSEASGDSTFHEVGEIDASATIPIGRPIDNTEIYILDRNGQPVPVGVPGELYIAGAGLARGYLDRPDLTAEKFVSNPFSGKPGDRMYRTGDRARYRRDGAIEYLGRLDSQVKVRGFRIDLGEVESALAAHPGVAKAVAVTRQDETGDCRLVGYVVANAGTRAADILEFVRRRLAGYMVPSALVLLDALPLTPNGKVDRQALPAPGVIRREAAEPPRNPTEAVLSAIWADVLGIADVSVHDNFFELGGHSLLAVQLVARVEQVFLTTLPLRSLFEAPTIAGLASLIVAPAWEEAAELVSPDSDRVEIEL